MICGALPCAAIGHTFSLMISTFPRLGCLYANLAALALDYVVRQNIAGTHLTYGYVTQLPVPSPSAYDEEHVLSFIKSRVLELTDTAWDIEPFAHDLGDGGPPFHGDEERCFAMRAELDAAFFYLYGIDRDDVDYIMETFPIVRRKDVQQHGTFRTKDLILQVYDAMAKATRTGKPYQTILDPPPATARATPPAEPNRDAGGRVARAILTCIRSSLVHHQPNVHHKNRTDDLVKHIDIHIPFPYNRYMPKSP